MLIISNLPSRRWTHVCEISSWPSHELSWWNSRRIHQFVNKITHFEISSRFDTIKQIFPLYNIDIYSIISINQIFFCRKLMHYFLMLISNISPGSFRRLWKHSRWYLQKYWIIGKKHFIIPRPGHVDQILLCGDLSFDYFRLNCSRRKMLIDLMNCFNLKVTSAN